jgi:allophycocyanin alpha subunit
MTASCLRDLDYYLRLITYGIVAGDVTPIEEIGIVGAKEMYNSLGTPIAAVVEGIRSMKSIASALLSGEDAAEAGSYFDYVAGALL